MKKHHTLVMALFFAFKENANMESNISGSVAIVIKATPEKVWDALVNPDMIKQYLFGTNTKTDWKPGSPIYFEGEYQGKTYQDKGTILEVVPNKLLKYSYWSSMSKLEDRPENYMNVTFKVTEDGSDHTMLTLLQENIADEESKKHSIENWHMVLGKMKQLLEH